jgi:hypothetical protein
MIIVITFIKAFIKDQIHWLISFLSKPKSKFNGVWIRFLNQIVKTQKFEIPNVLSRVDVSSKCNQKPLNQIPSILKNFTHIPPNSIEFRILELPPFFKIEILFGILKSSNEESCSLLNYLPIHIFFQIFRFQEVHLLFQSSQSDLKLLWLNRKIYYSFGPAHAHADRGPGTRPPFPSSPARALWWSCPPVVAALRPLPTERRPTCHCAGPPAPPPSTRRCPILDPPILLSLGFSSSCLSALPLLPPSWAPNGSPPRHLPTPSEWPNRSVPMCASKPSRYVSVINDNHLVSLMKFNAAKVDWGPYIKIHQQSELKWSIFED